MAQTVAPYQIHRTFEYKIRNFPEGSYRLNPHDHLRNLMWVLLEDPGVGQLLKIQTAARLNESLSGTQYTELDYYFGTFLHFGRLSEEIYPYDPFTDQLTSSQWQEVERKDSQYRERISLFMQSLMRGGTSEGLAMAAESACGYPCSILESWRYNQDLGLGSYAGRLTASNREVLIVPHTTTLSNSRRRAIYAAVRRIKPAHVVITVDENGLAVRQIVAIRHAASPSEYFEIRKYVTGVNPPAAPLQDRYFWVEDGVETEAPSFASMQTMESRWLMNNAVTSVETSIEDDVGVRSVLPSAVSGQDAEFGPWRDVDLADSPDNYPTGKYPGDSNKHDTAGGYLYAWESQAAYLTWLQTSIEAIGGQFETTRYRLPITVDLAPSATSDPTDALAPIRVEIQSLYYAR